MDKPTAINNIARRLAPRLWGQLTWAQFVDAMTGMTAQEKAELLAVVRGQSAQAIGDAVLRQTRAHIKTLAVAEATTRLADDTLSLAEMDGVL